MTVKTLAELRSERRKARTIRLRGPSQAPAAPPAVCVHRGGRLRDGQRGGVWNCALHGECSVLAPIRGIAYCASCKSKEDFRLTNHSKWQVGITTAPRKRYTLSETLSSLFDAGWNDSITVFAEPDSRLPAESCCQLVLRPHRMGVWQNWLAAARQLADSNADMILLAQDDVLFATHARHWLEEHGWPKGAAWLSLYTSSLDTGPLGWHYCQFDKRMGLHGALAWIFPRSLLQKLLDHPLIQDHKRATRIDTTVGKWSLDTHAALFCPSPSLAKHLGDTSTIWESASNSGKRQTNDWIGSYGQPDAMAFDWQPLATAVMITGRSSKRRYLAHRAVDAFRRQTYPRRELLIINDSEQPLLDSDSPHVAPSDAPVREIMVERQTLGELRNLAFDHAKGAVLIQWDDDDYHHADRIAYQVSHWRPGTCNVLQSQLRLDLEYGECFVMSLKSGIDGTIAYPRDTRHRYPPIAAGEDSEFVKAFARDGKRLVLSNDATLYTRIYHGQNTWERRHIMKTAAYRESRLVAGEQKAYVDQVRWAYAQTAKQRYRILAPTIAGWWDPGLLDILEIIDREQRQRDIRGHVLEIGVFHGRSFLGLATLLRADERAIAVDCFANSPLDGEVPHRIDRKEFERNFHRVFGETDTQIDVLEGDSLSRTATDYRQWGPIRIAHVDGGHDFNHARHDLEQAIKSLTEFGVLMIDDMFNPNCPEVGRAFYTVGENWPLFPFTVAGGRLFCTRGGAEAEAYFCALRHLGPHKMKVFFERNCLIL